MRVDVLELSAEEEGPPVSADRGIAPLSVAERQSHAPDRQLLAIDGDRLVARCSCWWSDVADVEGQRLGVIGHYAAADGECALLLLSRACDVLARAGCTMAAGPMDGNTWRRYRFIVDRGPEPSFFLEPDNPDQWPLHWSAAGFSPLAHYTSAVNDDLRREDPRTTGAVQRVAEQGVTIRELDPSRADADLRRLFKLSLASFARNFLYAPISEAEFMAQNLAVLPFVRPELVLLAERRADLVGFVFAVPDVLQTRGGSAIDTVVLKTVAVDPAVAGMGLGGALVDLVQRSSARLGFNRVIHALMHEQNVSRNISGRYGRTFRRYALFAQPLTPR
jgi:ribosomal protein S18 acetylase RimI-like enzyme